MVKAERACVLFLYDLCYYTSYVVGGHGGMQRTRPCVCACVFNLKLSVCWTQTARRRRATRFLFPPPCEQPMSNTVITSSPTRSTDDTMNNNKRPDQHDELQRLLVQKEGEIKHYRDCAEEAEHKLDLVTVSRRFQILVPVRNIIWKTRRGSQCHCCCCCC